MDYEEIADVRRNAHALSSSSSSSGRQVDVDAGRHHYASVTPRRRDHDGDHDHAGGDAARVSSSPAAAQFVNDASPSIPLQTVQDGVPPPLYSRVIRRCLRVSQASFPEPKIIENSAILRGPVPNYFIYRPTSYEIAHVASSSHLRCKWSSRVRVRDYG